MVIKLFSSRSKILSLQILPKFQIYRNFCDNVLPKTKSSLPEYNYGLTGKGKSKKRKPQMIPVINGELLFGVHPVTLALNVEKRTFYKLYLQASVNKLSDPHQQIVTLCNEKGITVMPSDKVVLDRLSGNRPHQGVCLDVSSLKVDTLDVDEFRKAYKMSAKESLPIWILLHRIQDPMNFGAILRSCYFLGVDRVIFSQEHSAPLNPVVSKSSSGAMEIVPISATRTEQTLVQMIKTEKKNGWKLIGSVGQEDVGSTSFDSAIPIEQFDATGPTILMIGNEGSGLSDRMLKLCDNLVTIKPKQSNSHPCVDSLNVSVATGILLHSLKKSGNPR